MISSTKKVKASIAVVVYPNPSNGTIYFKSVSGVVDIKVYALDGRFLESHKIRGNHTIHLRTSAGIYLLKTICQGKTKIQKMIIE